MSLQTFSCAYWSTNEDLAVAIASFDKDALQQECDRIDAQESLDTIDCKSSVRDLSKQKVDPMGDDLLKFEVEILRARLDLKQEQVSLMQRELDLMRREFGLKVEKLENELNYYRLSVRKHPNSPPINHPFLDTQPSEGKRIFSRFIDSERSKCIAF